MGKVKKQNLQKKTELKNSKVNKKSKALQEKVAVAKNGVSKVSPKKNSVKLPAAIIEGVKKEKNKKGLMKNGNMDAVVTEKNPKRDPKHPKAASTILQSGEHEGKNKKLKITKAQNATKNNLPVGKPKNKVKEKVGAENTLKEHPGPVPKLALPPSAEENKGKKTKGNKQVYQEKVAEIAAKGKGKKPSGNQEILKSAQEETELASKPSTKDTNNAPNAQKRKRAHEQHGKGAEIAAKIKGKMPPGERQEKLKSAQKESELAPKPSTEDKIKNASNVQKQKGAPKQQKQNAEIKGKKPFGGNQEKLKSAQKELEVAPKLSTGVKTKNASSAPEEFEPEIEKVPKVVSASLRQKLVKKLKKQKVVNKTQANEASENMDSVPFDEDKFKAIVKQENIVKVVEALKTKVAEEVSKQKNQIFADYRYVLNVTCFKIPMCPKRMAKLKVKHSLISDDDDVLLIVKDLKRGMRVDYEPTIHHYEDLLRAEGVKGIKTIMPFNQLKKEYGSYEMKTKLSNLYDYFLCEAPIMGHVVAVFGKIFQKSRCAPHAVRMNTKNHAREIEKALHKTSFKQGRRGTMISIPVAHHKMPANEIAENILEVISQLKTVYPGGLANVRNMYIRVNLKGTSALPLYISLASPPEEVPYIIGPKEAKIKKLKDEANTILEKFNITPGGGITRKRVIKNVEADVEEEPMKKKKKKAAKKLAKNVEGVNAEQKQIEEDVKEESKKVKTHSKITKENLNKKQVETQATQDSKEDSDEEDSDDETYDEEGGDQEIGSEDDDSEDDDSEDDDSEDDDSEGESVDDE